MRIAPAPKYILAPLILLAKACNRCCIVIVLKVYALIGNIGGSKVYFGAGAVRTATEALRVLGELYCLAGIWESITLKAIAIHIMRCSSILITAVEDFYFDGKYIAAYDLDSMIGAEL